MSQLQALLTAFLLCIAVAKGYDESLATRPRQARVVCSGRDKAQCVEMAYEMLKMPHLVFPNTSDDVFSVCQKWQNLTECLKNYVEACIPAETQRNFNQNVTEPIMEVNRVCTDEEYQKQYLEHSTCLQAMTAGPEWCSRHYTELLRVSHADTVRQSDLCCAHFKYRRCMLGKYSRCGREMIPQYKPAKEFVQRVMDNALSFFRDYCTGYCVDPVSDNCSGISELEAELMQEEDYSPATDICSKPIPSDSNSPSFTGLQSSRSPLDTNEIDSRRRSGRKEDNDVYPSSARLAPESREGFQGPSDGARLPPSDRRMDRGFGDLQPAPQPRGALDETQSYFGGKVNYAGFAGSYSPESREPSDVWSPAASNDINAQSLSGGNKGAPTSSPSNTLMHLAALICSLVFILH